MQKRKLFTLLSATALIAAVGVGSTMAYLSDLSSVKENTFTMAETGINMRLSEHDAMRNKETGEYELRPNHVIGDGGPTSVDGVDYIDLQPGEVVPKDPWVTINGSSVPCYVVVKVSTDKTNLEIMDINARWVKLNDNYDTDLNDEIDYYVYSDENGLPFVCDASDMELGTDYDLEPIFEHVKVSSEIVDDDTELDNIVVQAAAVQAKWLEEGVDPISMAVDMLNGETTTTENPEA